MKWSARLLLLVAALVTPGYWLLDSHGLVPVSLRDRPWPFALAAVAFPLLALKLQPRLRTLALALALLSAAALGGVAHLRYRLPASSVAANVGAPLRVLELPDESGKRVRLDGDRPLLFVWFRGSWCPYCRQQLAELSAELAHYSGQVRVLAVSPDPPEPLVALKHDLHLGFSLLSDPDRILVNGCELGHCVSVVDEKGVVRWGVVSGNWQKDLPARALLQAAYRLK